MARLVQTTQNKMKASFDPSKVYSWEQTDIFEITGSQLATLYHTLIREVNDPSGAPLLMKYEAYKTIMGLMELGVEQGVIVEREPNMAPPTASDEDIDGRVKNMFTGNEQE